MNKKEGNALIWILIIGAVTVFIFGNNNFSNSEVSEHATINRDEAISEYWGEIKEYINGTETIEACSSSSGSCYDLDADISNGEIEQIYFPNGGYLYFSADIDEDGSASDLDLNGNDWDFTIDTASSSIDDAIYDWASDNGYTIE